MNQNQLYPFERNRYYAGKMLTSADFQAEQSYFNNKERFLNTLMYGSGIVCGMSVFSLDDMSILVESGVAIDPFGREIVLDSSVVKKLSALEGYDDIETEEVYLGIKYNEEMVHSVYAVEQNNSGKEHEYSRVAENYKLFIKDTNKEEDHSIKDTEFLTGDVIYQDQDFRVELLIPTMVSRGESVRVVVKTTKLSDENNKLILHAIVQIPGLLCGTAQEINIDLEDIELGIDETYEEEYWISAEKNTGEDTTLLIKSGSAYAYINDEAVKVSTDFSVKILFTDSTPREIVNRAVALSSLEMRELSEKKDYVLIAKLKLINSNNSYVIDKIVEQGVKNYLTLPKTNDVRADFMDFYIPHPKEKQINAKKTADISAIINREAPQSMMPEMATGILEIPLGNNPKKDMVFYSGEIMHGLGKGNVYVQIGVELVSTDESLGANAKSTIYGNADLFSKDKIKVPNVDTAVKVLNDKGSFVVGAKLNENLDFILLTYRWVAIKFPTNKDINPLEDYVGKSIVPETPTVVLGARESHFFGVRFQNMDKCSINYTLTEENSGEITSDGIYTAPSKEGVYEICIYCTDMPVICAYAYAIVKKKDVTTTDDLVKATGINIQGSAKAGEPEK